MSLARRSLTSTFWNFVTSPTKIAILLFRAILLARILPVEVFGTYALAASIVSLSVIIPKFGMDSAFLHRADETENEQQAAAVHFTLKLINILIWAFILIVGSFAFVDVEVRLALFVITLTTAGIQLAETPRLILSRRVVHRRLALMEFLTVLVSSIVALILAWQGADIWALLSTDIAALTITITLLYLWRPVWLPKLTWDKKGMRYFIWFGGRSILPAILLQALNRIDDLWAGFYLGQTALGYYSRAYAFAGYPRELISKPLNTVIPGTYAELKGNRPLLSKAFYRSNAVLIRAGFLIAGVLSLVAPELILLFLGDKWLPMLGVFRLMLVFTLLDPIKSTVSKLFAAVGEPERLIKVRLLQLVIMLGGFLLLGLPYGIVGVAISVNAMLVVGMAFLFKMARDHVDFSLRSLFVTPGTALVVGLIATLAVTRLFNLTEGNSWVTGGIKLVMFSAIYCFILLIVERHQITSLVSLLNKEFFNKAKFQGGSFNP